MVINCVYCSRQNVIPFMQLITLDEQSTPLNQEQARQLHQLVQGLSPQQVTWVSGFLAGINWANQASPQPQAAASVEQPQLTILFGSQSGNSEAIARQARDKAIERGFKAKLE